MMQESIPFLPEQETGSDAFAGAAGVALNVVVDDRGALMRRPGIGLPSVGGSAAISTGAVLGLHETVAGRVYAVHGSMPGPMSVARLTAGGPLELVPGQDGAAFGGDFRPTFSETEGILAIAAGRAPIKIVLDGETPSLLGGSPPPASHVAAHSSRLLLNDTGTLKGAVFYSAPASGGAYAGHEQWGVATTALGSSGFFTTETRPDPVVAVAENADEVFVFGTSTMQVFRPDEPPYIFSPGASIEAGVVARNSIIRDDQAFAWLDHRRRFVYSDGRVVNVLSQPIQRTLDEIVDASDCFGYRVQLGNVDALVWSFPSAGRSFAYQRGTGWSQWAGMAAGQQSKLRVQCAIRRRDSSEVLVGLDSGRVGAMSLAANDDLGEKFDASVTTGFLSRGTDARKRCMAVRLALRLTAGAPTALDGAFLRWRDREGEWSSPLRVEAVASGGNTAVVSFRSLGVYRRRQWQFGFPSTVGVTLAGATETFEVLEA